MPTPTTDYVPVIDLSRRSETGARTALADTIGQACESSGFYAIVGHGIPPELIDRMYTVTKSFFTLPDADKDAVAHRPGVSGLRRSVGTTANSLDRETPPDLCETFGVHVTGDPDDAERAGLGDYWASWKLANLWPAHPDEFRRTWQEYLSGMESLAADLLRLGAHTDFGGLTVLYQETDRGGLQVQQGDTASRISVPFFYQPNHDAVITPIGETLESGVIAGQRMAAKMRKIVPADRE